MGRITSLVAFALHCCEIYGFPSLILTMGEEIPMASHRRTIQKTAVESVFKEAGRPLTPQEAWDLARATAPSLGIATVYRAIKVLLESEELTRVEVPGEPPRYEIAGGAHHHHFHCRACGKVYSIEGCAGSLKSLLPKGFTLDDHTIVLHGSCSDCAATTADKNGSRA